MSWAYCLTILTWSYTQAVPRENHHYGLDPDQYQHAAQDNPDICFSPPVDFLFQESLLYTSILLRRNVSARISLLRGLRRPIQGDTLPRIRNAWLFQESLLYTCIPPRRNVSARISLRRLHRLIWVDTLRMVFFGTPHMYLSAEIFESVHGKRYTFVNGVDASQQSYQNRHNSTRKK